MPPTTESQINLRSRHAEFTAICNARNWSLLPTILSQNFILNSTPLGLSGIISHIIDLVTLIPDLDFTPEMVIVDDEMMTVAARLMLDCTPQGEFMGLPINGRRVKWGEHILYRFDDEGKMEEIWVVADKGTVEEQLRVYDESGEFGIVLIEA